MSLMEKSGRQWRTEKALAWGKAHLRRQTGFIHYCYHPKEGEGHDTIPVYENFLYALALLRSHTAENVQEAKQLIAKLLPFYDQGFPIYLHQYPDVFDPFQNVRVLPVLYRILKGYGTLIGEALQARLRDLVRLEVQGLMAEERRSPYWMQVKAAAVIKAFGGLLHEGAWMQESAVRLEKLSEETDASWNAPLLIGELLTALQLSEDSLGQTGWRRFFAHVCQTYHQGTLAYAGPSMREYQLGLEPERTLYDIQIASYAKHFPARLESPCHAHMEGVLIETTEDLLERDAQQRIPMEGWLSEVTPEYAYSVLRLEHPIPPEKAKGFYPFRVCWGSEARVHTLGCQGGNIQNLFYEVGENEILLHLVLGEPSEEENREKNREVCFYLDLHPETKMQVNHERATTFALGDAIHMELDGLRMKLQMDLVEGEGTFMGHLMRGNRPAQLLDVKERNHEAYDQQIFLRSISRTPHAQVNVRIGFESLD